MNMDNRQRILEDEREVVKDALKTTRRRPILLDKHNAERKKTVYSSALILSDGSRPGLLAAETYCYEVAGYDMGVELFDLSEEINVSRICEKIVNNMVVYAFFDAERTANSASIVNVLKDVFDAVEAKSDVRVVVSLVVPEPQGIPDKVLSVAEREYDYLLEKRMSGPERDYAVELHRLCREAVRGKGISLTLIRHTNVIGPLSDGSFAKKFDKIISDAFVSRQVEIGDVDYARVVDVTLVTDVVTSAFWAVVNAVSGHEFNVVSYRTSLAHLKNLVFSYFREELSLKQSCSAGLRREYFCLNTLKFSGTRWRRFQKGKIKLSAAVARIACYLEEREFGYEENTAVYDGRLPKIKAVEMEILREIDAICRKHNIKYFLAGGTLLGAVRYGSSIPWDDDFDIGFLRKDFDRFRKVCDEELGEKFVHTCYYNGTNSHYMVDKIRMRDTYFSTRYSSIHAVEDGVFIDCLVYDASYSNKILAKLHDKASGLLGRMVQAYWREYRRNEVKTKLRWIIIKAMELLPIGFYHRLYSWVISLRKKCESPTCLIDSMGKHIGLGTIPFKGLEDVKRVPFDDGFMAPIPQDPTGYLVYDYGEGYLPPPPYCKQVAPHNFARIDLGKYLYCSDGETKFRSVDLRGELFEQEVACE